MADEVSSAGAYAPVVARMRTRRRARYERFSPFPAIRATPVRATSPRRDTVGQPARCRILAGAVVLWLLCLAAPWSLSLAMHRSILAPVASLTAPPDSPLDDLLIRLLAMTPTGYIHGYAGTAEVAAWSPDGRYLVAGYSSGRLLLWDSVHQGRVALRVWQAHRGAVSALAWSPNGYLLASAGAGSAAVWRIGPRGAPARLWAALAPSAVGVRPAVAFSPDGRALAVADGIGTVSVWRLTRAQGVDPATSAAVAPTLGRRLLAPGRTTALAWSDDGAYLAVGTVEGRVSVWHTADMVRTGGKGAGQAWPRVTRALGSHIWTVAWSPALPILAAGGSDGTVRLLAGRDLGQLALLATPFRTTPVLKAPDAGVAAVGEGEAPRTGARGRGPRLAAGAAINAVQWSPGRQALAITATGVPLRLWQPLRGVATTYDENWDMNAVAWRPGGNDAALASDDGSLTLLRVAPPDALARTACILSLRQAEWCAPLGRRIGLPVLSPPSYMSR